MRFFFKKLSSIRTRSCTPGRPDEPSHPSEPLRSQAPSPKPSKPVKTKEIKFPGMFFFRSSHFLSLGPVFFGLFFVLALAWSPLANSFAGSSSFMAPLSALATMAVSEIKAGMKGYGLTVFRGTEPEKFDVEVVDVLHNFRPGQELILVKTDHPRLNVTKNVRGMSGSPIFIDGRLIGAYAYSWAKFQVEPVAGVTPIAPMLAEMHRDLPAAFLTASAMGQGQDKIKSSDSENFPHNQKYNSQKELSPELKTQQAKHLDFTSTSASSFHYSPGYYDLKTHGDELANKLGNGTSPSSVVPSRVSTPLMMGGVGTRTASYVKNLFEPLGLEPMQAGGSSAEPPKDTPMHYTNGSAIGVSFVRGDISFFGMGTVTYVEGHKLCAFGHPMMEAGASALPTSLARVLWIFASEEHSSKIGESIRSLGTLIEDRQSAIVVDENKVAPTFPFSVNVKGAEGAPKTNWEMIVAEEKFLSPGFVSAALSAVIEATTNERQDLSWKLNSSIFVREKGKVEIEDIGFASGGMPGAPELARINLIKTLGELLNNPWETIHIDRVQSTLSVERRKNMATLKAIDVLDPVVDPGGLVRVALRYSPPYGRDKVQEISFRLPHVFENTEVEVTLTPGYDFQAEIPTIENFSQLVHFLNRREVPYRSMVAQIKLPSSGVMYKEFRAENLPPFALDMMKTTSTSGGPEGIPSYSRTTHLTEMYMNRGAKFRVKTKARVH